MPTNKSSPIESDSFDIAATADVGRCEEIISESHANRTATLHLPSKWVMESHAGGSGIAAQAVATWARNTDSPTLVLKETPLESFADRFYGIVAAMLADRILLADSASDVTRQMWALVGNTVSAMNRMDIPRLIHGRALSLICVDQSTMALLRPLYHPLRPEDPIRSLTQIRDLIRMVFMRLIKSRKPRLESALDPMAVLLRELFSNTHFHARTDELGKRYRRSVRGVNFAVRVFSRSQIARQSSPAKSLRSYYEQLSSGTDDEWLKFAEMTVFDSGPGLAARMRGKPLGPEIPADEEYRLIRRCFEKNVTTLSETGHGFGLPLVMRVVQESRGYLHLRTGRLSLYHSFSDVDGTSDRLELLDDDSRSLDVNARGNVAGSAFTILLPIQFDGSE